MSRLNRHNRGTDDRLAETVMPFIESLPDEVLDGIFAQFYPRERHPLLTRFPLQDEPPPSENLLVLLTCRLVSRTFDRFASSWAFRRIHIHEFNTEEALEKHAFLTRYERLAVYVRVLTLSLDAVWASPFTEEETFIDVAAVFKPFFEAMVNVRAILVGGLGLGESDSYEAIMMSLLKDKPYLEALYLDGVMLPAVRDAPPKLKMFHLRSEQDPSSEALRPFTSKCSALSLGPIPDDMPWDILNELAVAVEGRNELQFVQLRRSLSNWALKNPGRIPALRELSVRSRHLNELNHFLRDLSNSGVATTLRSLNMVGDWTGALYTDQPAVVQSCSEFFPLLEELGYFPIWRVHWSAFQRAFQRAFGNYTSLRILRTQQEVLEWFVNVLTPRDELPYLNDYADIESGMEAIRVLVTAVPTLTEIRTNPLRSSPVYYRFPPHLPALKAQHALGDVPLKDVQRNMAGVITFLRDPRSGGLEKVQIRNVEWEGTWDLVLTKAWQGDGGGEM